MSRGGVGLILPFSLPLPRPWGQSITRWQVLGTLPDSLQKGRGCFWPVPLILSLLGFKVAGEVDCGPVVLVRPLRTSTPDPLGTHTQPVGPAVLPSSY